MSDREQGGVLLYDGVCALCNRTVQYLMDCDTHGILRFAPLQGETAKKVWERYPGKDPGLKTVVYVRGYGTPEERLFFRSRAILEIMSDLGGKWRLLVVLKLIPGPLRDAVYDWIARHRYAWFGKYDQCRLPEKGTEDRFLP